jgi:RNA polymerase sigma-70 factor (ECF subfamily)
MEESEALTRLRAGDIAGLETLVTLYQSQALDVAYIISHDRPLAEDVVQTAFIRAYERIEQLHHGRSFGPWFLRSVVNDTLKAVTRSHNLPLDMEALEQAGLLVSPDRSAYELIEAAETREAIWDALDLLSPAQRAAVVMRYYLDLTDTEVAEALHAPPGTVRRRLHDGRRRLRSLLPAWILKPQE